jgi:hypothetical protein
LVALIDRRDWTTDLSAQFSPQIKPPPRSFPGALRHDYELAILYRDNNAGIDDFIAVAKEIGGAKAKSVLRP